MKSKVVDPYKEDARKDNYNKKLGVITNGKDNIRPLVIENLIDASPSASQCVEIYDTFLAGAGFKLPFLNDINLNDFDHNFKSINDLLSDVTESISRHNAVFINVHYNANYQKDSFQVIPYTLCRLGKKDDNDFSGKVVVSENGWGKRVKKDDLKVFNSYNPNPAVIEKQVEAAGGWHNYKGQILYFQLNEKHTYSQSDLEKAYLFSDVEHQLGLYYNSTVKRGFEDISMIRHRAFDNEKDKKEFYENVEKLSGIENASSKLIVEDDWDDEREKTGNIKIDHFESNIQADKYKHFEQSSANMIRKAYGIPPQLVDYIAGSLGNTSGEDLVKAQSIYNAKIAPKKSKISRLFSELFRNYKLNVNPEGNWKIKQYKLIDDGTADDDESDSTGSSNNTKRSKNEEDLNKKAQANLRGSVGGVTGVLSIQKSVSEETTSYNSGVTMLVEIYGYSEEVARDILGQPKIKKENDGTTNQ